MNKNGLIGKIRLMSQPGKQTIGIQILLNISRSESNQTVKFGRLIENNMKNIVVKKIIQKMGRRNYSQSLL